jgi:hypothetical protein
MIGIALESRDDGLTIGCVVVSTLLLYHHAFQNL